MFTAAQKSVDVQVETAEEPGTEPSEPGNEPGTEPSEPGNEPGTEPSDPDKEPGMNPSDSNSDPDRNTGGSQIQKGDKVNTADKNLQSSDEASQKTVKTGDEGVHPVFWISLMAICVVAAVSAAARMRKRF